MLKLEDAVKGFSKSKNWETTIKMGTKLDETTHATINMDTTFVREMANSNSLQAATENENGWRKSSYQNTEKLIDLWNKSQTVESSANESMKFRLKITDTNSNSTVQELKSKLTSMNMKLNKVSETTFIQNLITVIF